LFSTSHVNCYSGRESTTLNPAELDRQITMEEYASRMKEIFKKRIFLAVLPPEEFSILAHSMVFGASQKVTRQNQKPAHPQQNKAEGGPAYEPDDAEMANSDDGLEIEEEERNAKNTSSKVSIHVLLRTFLTAAYYLYSL
jgi:hypothetical protein